MMNETIALKVNLELYDKYKEYCKKGLIILKQFENFMVEELKKNKSSV